MTSVLVTTLLLSACGAVESVNNSITYVNDASEYVQQISTAGTELQGLAEQAVTDPQIATQMKETLQQIQTEASEFTQLTPPALGEAIHTQLVQYNEQLMGMVESFKTELEQRGFTQETWEQTGIPDLISNINNLREQLGGLGG